MKRTTTAARIGGVIVALEGVGLVLLAGFQIVALAAGDDTSPTSAIALTVVIGIGAVAVAAFAVAILRGLTWGRSGGIVIQLLIVGVAVGAATGVYAAPFVGAGLAVPAVAALVLLILASRDAGRDRTSDGAD